ncbi:hypothetical protein EBT31_02015 [bacterium]|nr:hypothetical protein [bacterium]
MSTNDLFILASRKKYRFPSDKGDLTTEQLWDVPLTSRNGYSVDNIAIAVNRELRSLQEESFVQNRSNPRRSELQNMLDILKEVIAIRQAESEQATELARKQSQKKVIQEAIERKRQQNLESMSLEELEAMEKEMQ